MGPSKNIVIVSGRSGGHAFPALAVAEALLELESDLKIHLIHTGNSLEKEIFSKEGWITYTLSPLALAGGVSFISRLKTLFFLPFVFVRVFFLIVRVWPRAVFGTGGAISAPVLLSAFFLGRRRAAWEGNTVCGLANRLLTPFLPTLFTVFPNVPKISERKQTLCGYPLRKGFYQKPLEKGYPLPEKKAPNSSLKELPKGKGQDSLVPDFLEEKESKFNKRGDVSSFQVLVLGGSQGSSLLNQVVSEALLEESWRQGVFIFHQTGKRDFSSLREKYKGIKGVEAFSFSSHIKDYYKKCDLIFSRAGSGALAEVSAMGKPLVLVPLSGTAGDHQVQNAIHLERQKMTEWISEKELTAETFKKKVLQLKNNPEKRKTLAQNIIKRHKPEGALTIARWLLKKTNKRSSLSLGFFLR